MNDRTIKILNKLFPYAEVEEQQSFGILKIYIRLGNYFLCEFITSVIGKTDIEIIKECVDYFIDKLIKFTINEEEFLKLKKELYKWKFII